MFGNHFAQKQINGSSLPLAGQRTVNETKRILPWTPNIAKTYSRRLLLSYYSAALIAISPSSTALAQSACTSASLPVTHSYVEKPCVIQSGGAPSCVDTPGSNFGTLAALEQDVGAQSLAVITSYAPGCGAYLEGFINGGGGQITASIEYSVRSVNGVSCSTLTSTPFGGNNVWGLFSTTNLCPSGYTYNSPSNNCPLTDSALLLCGSGGAPGNGGSSMVAPTKTDGACDTCAVGDPITVSTGNVYVKQVDYALVTLGDLVYIRHYNSDPNVSQGRLGTNWRDSFDRQVVLSTDLPTGSGYSGPTIALVYRPDGRVVTFNVSGSSPVPTDPDTVETLSQPNSATWVFATSDDVIETYNVVASVRSGGPVNYGQLATIQSRGGLIQTLTYNNTTQNLTSVVDVFGHSLSFTYDASNRVVTMTDLAGNVFNYGYNTNGYLSDVYFPGPAPGSTSGAPHRQYQYETLLSKQFLHDILDESGNQNSTWAYDSSGRAITSSIGSFQETHAVSYAGSAGTGSTVTDGAGGSSVYAFAVINGVPKYTNIVAQGTMTQSAAYDANGRPTSITDRNGITTTSSSNFRGLEVTRTEAAGTASARTITTTWHSTFHLPLQISTYAGGTATGSPIQNIFFMYDSNGNLTSKTIADPLLGTTRTWTYTADVLGHRITATGPRTDLLDETQYSYYNCTTGYQCGQIATVTNSIGQATTFNTYNADGLPLTITDPNGTVTTLAYDNQQHVVSKTLGSETTALSYYPTGLVNRVTIPDGSWLTYSYDTEQRLIQLTDGLGNKLTYTLSAMGDRTTESAYDSASHLNRTLTRTFDALQRMSAQYGAADTSAVETVLGYDGNDNLTSASAPLSRITTSTYDAFNRLASVTNPASGLSQYQYNALDLPTSVTDPKGYATTYQYDALGDLLQLSSPDTGATTSVYDSGGNLNGSTNAASSATTYTHDALNRVTTSSYAGNSPTQTIAYSYDVGPHGLGRLTGASDANQTTSWAYDSLGRVNAKTQLVSGVSESAAYSTTSADLTQIQTPSGQVLTYSYTNGQVSSITVNGTLLLSAVAYEPFGPVKSWTWGNATTETHSHTTDGNPYQYGAVEIVTLAYDNASRITGAADSSLASRTWTYGYDALDRLTTASKSGMSLGWSYDADSNRLTQTGSAETYAYSSSNNQGSTVAGAITRTYSYDLAGNTTSTGLSTFTYNNRGRISSSTTGGSSTTYVYNAAGQRIAKLGSAPEIYFYDEAGHLLGEYTNSGALIQETVWLGDTPVATIQPLGGTTAIYYVHADQLNAPRIITRPSDNQAVWRWDTDPFGALAANSNPNGLGVFTYNLRFPGQYLDAETGLSYNYFRDYDSGTGRYLESDPMGLAAGVNTYGYVGGNPVSFFDSLGWARMTFGQVSQAVQANNFSGLSNEFIICQIWKESAFNPTGSNQKSSAIGLMSMTTGAVADVARNVASQNNATYAQMTDPAKNVGAASAYLGLRIRRAEGNVAKGTNGFGTGPGYIDNLYTCESCLKNVNSASKAACADPKKCLNKIHK
jgi:RHS repeat-associated protein